MFPQSSVVQAVLADMSNTHRSPAVRGLYWIVSMNPSGIPDVLSGPGAVSQNSPQASFLVVFVDAATGTVLEAMAGSMP